MGFEPYLDSVIRLLDRIGESRGQTVLVTGEAGIGKSRFISEVKKQAGKRNLLILEGGCFEPDQTVSFAPIHDLLRDVLKAYPADRVLGLLGSSARQWARTLPELERDLPDGSYVQPASEQENRRLLRDIAQFFVRLSSIQPLLIVLEDLHWSDDNTLEFLHYLAREITTEPILLLLTYRSDEASACLTHLLAELDRERLAVELSLPRLSIAQVDQMVRAVFGLKRPVRSELLEAIYSLTGGNPFSIEEVLKLLAPTGDIFLVESALDRNTLSPVAVPRSVLDDVSRRLRQVSVQAIATLSLAAVVGNSFDFGLLQELTTLDESVLLKQIKELIDAQLIVEMSADRFAFRNTLTRQAIYSQLLARERRVLHKRIGEAMEGMHSIDLGASLDDLAYHFFEASSWERALAYSERAGEVALARYNPRVAVEHFTRALEASRQLGLPPNPRLYRLRGLIYDTLGQFGKAYADQETALQAASVSGDRHAEWCALLELGKLWAGRDYERSGQYYRQAISLAHQIGKPAASASSLNRMGTWHLGMEQMADALKCHQDALALYEEVNDQHGIGETLSLTGAALYAMGNIRESADYYDRSVVLLRKLDDRQALVSSLPVLSTLRGPSYLHSTVAQGGSANLSSSSRPIKSRSTYDVEDALKLARDIHWRLGEANALCSLANSLGAQGEYANALALANANLLIVEELDHAEGLAAAHCLLGALFVDLFALNEAREELERALTLSTDIGCMTWMYFATGLLVETCIQQGDLARVEALLGVTDELEDLPQSLGQRLVWCARAELALAEGDPHTALGITDQLMSCAGKGNGTGSLTPPKLSLHRAEALAGLGRLDEAIAELKEAKQSASSSGMRSMLWRVQATLGKLLQQQGHQTEAADEFSEALSVIEELALHIPDDEQRKNFQTIAASAIPRTFGSSLRSVSRKENGGLTTRELEVAVLIAEGKSNYDIATELVVSKRTIETHLSSILSKLGFVSRKQIASWAVEKRLEKRQAV
ncbi:MAG: AAA family ATPase [Chloroflexota bacterium]